MASAFLAEKVADEVGEAKDPDSTMRASLQEELDSKDQVLSSANVLESWDDRVLGMTPHNPVRRVLLNIVKHPLFDAFILLCIIANSVFMGLADFRCVDRDTGTIDTEPTNVPGTDEPLFARDCRGNSVERNELFLALEAPFNILFMVELAMRMLALGPVAYFRDRWNWIDFVVTVFGAISLFATDEFAAVDAIRVVRALRPLRSLSKVQKLQVLVLSVLHAIPQLVSVLAVLVLLYVVFAVLGLSLFMGTAYARCRITPYPVLHSWTPDQDFSDFRCLNASNVNLPSSAFPTKGDSPWRESQECFWPLDESDERNCALISIIPFNRGYECQFEDAVVEFEGVRRNFSRTCGSNYDGYGSARFSGGFIPLYNRTLSTDELMDRPVYLPSKNYGYPVFDNVFTAIVTIIQVNSLEGWAEIMINAMDSTSPVVAALFFILLVIVGAFVVLNLVLAVLEASFSSRKVILKQEKKRKKQLQDFKRKRRGSVVTSASTLQESLKEVAGSFRLKGGKGKQSYGQHISSVMRRVEADEASSRSRKKFMALAADAESGSMSLSGSSAERTVATVSSSRGTGITSSIQRWTMMDYDHQGPLHILREAFANNRVQGFLLALVILNAAVLAVDRHPIDDTEAHIYQGINGILTIVFALELAIKILAFGPYGFIAGDKAGVWWAMTDALITVLALLQLILDPPLIFGGDGDSSTASVSALRAFRAFRLFHIFPGLRKLQTLLKKMFTAFVRVSTIVVLLGIVVYIYALLGMNVFANRLRFDEDTNQPVGLTNPGWDEAVVPRSHFDALDQSVVTLFILLTGENWDNIMFDMWRARGVAAPLFVISFIVFGQLFIVNLLVAVLISTFEGSSKRRGSVLATKEGKQLEQSRTLEALNLAQGATVRPDSAADSLGTMPPLRKNVSSRSLTGDRRIRAQALRGRLTHSTSDRNLGHETEASQRPPRQGSSRRLGRDGPSFFGVHRSDSARSIPSLPEVEAADRLSSVKEVKREVLPSQGMRRKLSATILAPLTHPLVGDPSAARASQADDQSSKPSDQSSLSTGDAKAAEEEVFTKEESFPKEEEEVVPKEQPEPVKRRSWLPPPGGWMASENAEGARPRSKSVEALTEAAIRQHDAAYETKEPHTSSELAQSPSSSPFLQRHAAPDLTVEEFLSVGPGKHSDDVSSSEERPTGETIYLRRVDFFRMLRALHDAGSSVSIVTSGVVWSWERVMGYVSRFRDLCSSIVESIWFSRASLIAILMSCVILVLDTPLSDPDSQTTRILTALDYTVTCLFALEAAIKISAMGFLCPRNPVSEADTVQGTLRRVKDSLLTPFRPRDSTVAAQESSNYIPFAPTSVNNKPFAGNRLSDSQSMTESVGRARDSNMTSLASFRYGESYGQSSRSLRARESFSSQFSSSARATNLTSSMRRYNFASNDGSGRIAYLQDTWNRLDFVIVIVSVLSMALDVSGVNDNNLDALKALRAGRALRPLALVKTHPQLRLVVAALFASTPDILNLVLIILLMFAVFAVLFTAELKGELRACMGSTFDAFVAGTIFQDVLENPRPFSEFTAEEQSAFINADFFDYTSDDCQSALNSFGTTGREMCDCYGAEWDEVVPQVFDNVGISLLSLLEMCTTEGWADILYAAADARGIDEQPIRDANWDSGIPALFIVFMLLGSFFAVSAFIGVIYDNFVRKKRNAEREGYPTLITEEQARWIEVATIGAQWRPKAMQRRSFVENKVNSVGSLDRRSTRISWSDVLQEVKPGIFSFDSLHRQGSDLSENSYELALGRAQPGRARYSRLRELKRRFRRQCLMLTLSDPFRIFIVTAITLNTIVLCMQFFGQPSLYTTVLEIMNLAFLVIFILEAMLKVTGTGWRRYISDHWNKFDFLLVVLGVAQFAFFVTVSGSDVFRGNEGRGGGTGYATVLRAFRILRALRMMKASGSIRQMFGTIVRTTPALVNVGALLVLCLFVFAIIGNQLFAKVAFNDSGVHGPRMNFRDVHTGMLTLFRFTTGENWNEFMHDLAQRPEGCTADPEYDPGVCYFEGFYFKEVNGCVPLDGCGSILIYPYMLLFVVAALIIVNLLIGAVLTAFDDARRSNEEIEKALDKGEMYQFNFREFQQAWAVYDPSATSYITIDQLGDLLQDLQPPWGFGREHLTSERELNRKLRTLSLKVYEECTVHFVEVLVALSMNHLREQAAQSGAAGFKAPEELRAVRALYRNVHEVVKATRNGRKPIRDCDGRPFTVAHILAFRVITRSGWYRRHAKNDRSRRRATRDHGGSFKWTQLAPDPAETKEALKLLRARSSELSKKPAQQDNVKVHFSTKGDFQRRRMHSDRHSSTSSIHLSLGGSSQRSSGGKGEAVVSPLSRDTSGSGISSQEGEIRRESTSLLGEKLVEAEDSPFESNLDRV
uniref:Uncharacterized protein n=1 Tax=Pinguiococcus pyrenoidosus TaxID=172671 RepID=A0A7R9YEG0_9STRA|mmetsp:Transcript_6845/g.26428  ORF Transcript_6845/g.26428 Transcript_6845/m.26428 type:complete len:2396 (+) Transcript_6845:164-7351(+)